MRASGRRSAGMLRSWGCPVNTAVVFSVPMSTSSTGLTWRWRSKDGRVESQQGFAYYYDCLANARENGYAVKPEPAHGLTAPDHGALRA